MDDSAMFVGVRGATTVSRNQPDAIEEAVGELMDALVARNTIACDAVVSVFFTVTPDLTALNPAKALRQCREGWDNTPLLCSQEPVIDTMLAQCIRVLIQWEVTPGPDTVIPVYLNGARTLRPDLV